MKSSAERVFVGMLFVLVLITFTLAQRDSKRLDRLYTGAAEKKTARLVTRDESAPLLR